MWQVVATRTAWRRPVYWLRVPVRPAPGGARPAIAAPRVQVITSAEHRARAIERSK
jgi:hypothetical protein